MYCGPMIVDRDSFAHRLRVARIDRQLSQAELGELVGRRVSAVCGWERGRSEPDLRLIVEIATALGVFPPWLAFGWGAMR